MPAECFTIFIRNRDMQMRTMDRNCTRDRNDLEMTFILGGIFAVRQAQHGVCEASHPAQNTSRLNMFFHHKGLNRVKQVLSELQTKGIILHSYGMSRKGPTVRSSGTRARSYFYYTIG